MTFVFVPGIGSPQRDEIVCGPNGFRLGLRRVAIIFYGVLAWVLRAITFR
jgi:hypothetical protein